MGAQNKRKERQEIKRTVKRKNFASFSYSPRLPGPLGTPITSANHQVQLRHPRATVIHSGVFSSTWDRNHRWFYSASLIRCHAEKNYRTQSFVSW